MRLVVRNSKPVIEICVRRIDEELFPENIENTCHAHKASKYMDAKVSTIIMNYTSYV